MIFPLVAHLTFGSIVQSEEVKLIFSSPTGREATPCSIRRPCDIHSAIDYALKLRRDSEVKLILLPGVYKIQKKIEIHELGSALPQKKLLIVGSKRGAVEITGDIEIGVREFEYLGNYIYRFKSHGFLSRQIYSQGARLRFARYPNDPHQGLDGWYISGFSSSGHLKLSNEAKAFVGALDESDFSMELSWFSNWLRKIDQVQYVNREGVLQLRNFGFYGESGLKMGNQANSFFFLYNRPEFFAADGDWCYHDGYYYIFKPRGVTSDYVVSIPRLDTLLDIKGIDGGIVENVSISNIDFSYSTWSRPFEVGYVVQQAGLFFGRRKEFLPGMISVSNASNISFDNLKLQNVGAWGVAMYGSLNNVNFSNSRISKASAGGIYVFSGSGYDGFVANKINVSDNYINNIGLDYSDSVAILMSRVSNSSVVRNFISNVPYSAISIGWRWDDLDYGVFSNVISDNFISGAMQIHSDGGAVYVLGHSSSSVINDNVVVNMHRSKYAGPSPISAVFLDNGSSGWLVKDNFIDVSVPAFTAVNLPNSGNFFIDNCVLGSFGDVGLNFNLRRNIDTCSN